MIEQVFYRRNEQEQRYTEFMSDGMTKEQAHDINIVMQTVASQIKDLNAGVDSPFMIYPFLKMKKVCIAVFQREFFQGRSNSVNHGILISQDEYQEMEKNPENIWRFTYRNFISRNADRNNKMVSLKGLEIDNKSELNKEGIFQEYHLHNAGFIQFLSAVYTSLSKKEYTCGIEIDDSRDANKVMRHFGYLIMSMLPFELRYRVSFCSRGVFKSEKITVQVIRENDRLKTDVTYNLNSEEFVINNTSVEIMDFYLKDLLDMSDDSLKNYFTILDEFKNDLNLAKDSKEQYVITKLLKLSQQPELFETETSKSQLEFIKDVFLLPTKKKDIINPIVVSLLPYVDSEHYIEVFDINLEIYQKLNPEEYLDKKIMSKIEDNLLQIYSKLLPEEKISFFKKVFDLDDTYKSVYNLLASFIDLNDTQVDMQLLESYISLYEVLFNTELRDILYEKIETIFRNSELTEKVKIWTRLYNSTNKDASSYFRENILREEDESFQKAIFSSLVTLFQESKDSEEKKYYHDSILDVIDQEDDDYRVKILCEYNEETGEIENILWAETYNSIQNLDAVATNTEFLRCLEKKYYNSVHSTIRDLYLSYVKYKSTAELEKTIQDIAQKSEKTERELQLLNKILVCLIDSKEKVSLSVLKELVDTIKEQSQDKLSVYISRFYLSDDISESREIYDFLEKKYVGIYNNPNLNKEHLQSFDCYYAENLNEDVITDREQLSKSLEYLENFTYNEKSYDRIFSIYKNIIEQIFTTEKSDYDRYLKCKEVINKLNSILQTQFGRTYVPDLINKVKECFWNLSTASTFCYEHCDIYRSISEVYSDKYLEHENHVLAEMVTGLIDDYYTDWDKVYKLFLSQEYIKKDKIRVQIAEDFIKQYRNNGLNMSEEYIAFVCMDKSNLKMNYPKLFENLQRHNYSIDKKSISKMKIFEYIAVSDEEQYQKQLQKKLREFQNYHSEQPKYGEIIAGLLIEQIVLLVLLVSNNIARTFILKISDNMEKRNLWLFCSYTGYVVAIVGAVVLVMILMIRANLRKSRYYDTYVFGLLIVSLVFNVATIIFCIKFSGLIINIVVSVIAIILVIALNLKASDKIGRKRKSKEEQGGDSCD